MDYRWLAIYENVELIIKTIIIYCMKIKDSFINITHVQTINYCCSEIMASVMELNDAEYDKLFSALCRILKSTPKKMNKQVIDNALLGSGAKK